MISINFFLRLFIFSVKEKSLQQSSSFYLYKRDVSHLEALPRDKRVTINFTNLLCFYIDRREPCSSSAIEGESSSLLQIAWFNVLAINSSWNQHRDNVSTIRNGDRKLLDFSDVQPWPVFFFQLLRFARPLPFAFNFLRTNIRIPSRLLYRLFLSLFSFFHDWDSWMGFAR